MGLSKATVLEVGRHFSFVIIGKDALLVEGEDSWHIEFTVDDTVSKDLLHHLLL
jgi:acetolactate synthase regulatory subunit